MAVHKIVTSHGVFYEARCTRCHTTSPYYRTESQAKSWRCQCQH